jgi:hypothetical protein
MRSSLAVRRPFLCACWLAAAVWLFAALPALGDGWMAPLSDGAALPLPSLSAEVPNPAAVLGGPLGARFHRHAELLAYLERLAAASPRVSLERYGETYEGRPLVLLAISDPANIEQLESLRRRHLARLSPDGRLEVPPAAGAAADDPVVVWLGYGVHGNESSSAEAALGLAYVLAAADDPAWQQRLRNVIVLVDPLSNPDGRDRYVTGYQQRRGALPDPSPEAFEHGEPWPGGRYNHYLFDLNRDWAWATQAETRARLAAFRRWEPQVHVDLHEMGSGSTYFFPPPADPIHPAISPRVVEWLEVFGRSNAAAFDALGWLFYKAQRYDLFYPAYGDSYPSLGGAVGMTYEMAGGGRAGLVIEREGDTPLRLADRVARHLVTSLATVEAAADNRRELLADFRALRRSAATAPNAERFLWRADQPEAEALAALLASHGITVQRLSAPATVTVRPLTADAGEQRSFEAGALVVSTAQPLGALAATLLEGDADLGREFVERQRALMLDEREPEFYDVTAWSLPMAFNLEVWQAASPAFDVAPGSPPASLPLRPWSFSPSPAMRGEGRVGFLMPPQGLAGYRFAAALHRAGIRYRLALSDLTLRGEELPAGTLFIPRGGNTDALAQQLAELAAQTGVHLSGAETSYSDRGLSLGSDEMVPVRPAVVGLVTGDGVSPTAAGALWHLFDETVGLDHRLVELDGLEERLAELDVLVLPEGYGYGGRLGDEAVAALGRWVEAGGTLVAIGSAADWLREVELSSVESWQPPSDAPQESSAESAPAMPAAGRTGETASSASSGRNPLRDQPVDLPGAVLRSRLRTSHPLAAGLLSAPPVLYRGSRVWLPAEAADGNVLVVDQERPVAAGLVWEEVEPRLAGSLLVGVERRGGGRVIVFAQDPAFRGFWRGTMPLLLNAVLFAPSF